MPDAASQLTPASASVSSRATIAVSVHGPAGVLDLVVPVGATPVDVSRAYADQAGLVGIPLLQTATGQHLRADLALGEIGVEPGTVLVAATGVRRPRRTDEETREPPPVADSPQVAAVAVALAVGASALSAWYAALSGDDVLRTLAVVLLAVCALAGAVPAGRHAHQRSAAAPGFGAAAAFAALFEPGEHVLAAVVAVSALAAASTAALARAMRRGRHQVLAVWIATTGLVFVVCAVSPLMGWDDRVSWALLLLLAVLGARFVPSLAVDVPDETLLDVDRLAVTAWSARDRLRRTRGRIVIPESVVRRLVEDASRTVTASCAAIFVTALLATPLLLVGATIDLDRIGARCLTFFAGAALVLAARQYRHTAARRLLRGAGLVCWTWLLVLGIDDVPPTWLVGAGALAVVLGAAGIATAVATGRGWRSVWWARRAEVAEGLSGAFALAATVVASGLFRALWETTS